MPRRVKGLGETPSAKHTDFQWVLDDLCADLGVCLLADVRLWLSSEAESFSLDDFVDAVLQAEGPDEQTQAREWVLLWGR